MTSSSNETLERIAHRIPIPESAYERFQRRRDRKRRSARIAAGAVGMAVFLAAVLTAGAVGLSDRSAGPAGGAENGPAETGPAATKDGWDGLGLPPEDAVPSIPVEGEVIAEFRQEWPPDAPGGRGFVYVYADGRVISYSADDDVLIEQRLTPEGVDIVRSGGPFGHPIWNGASRFLLQSDGTLLPSEVFEGPGAWADSEPKQYVPARYAVCYAEKGFRIVDPSTVVGLLPVPAEALLDGKERTYEHATLDAATTASRPASTCFEVTTEEARALDELLSDAGFEKSTAGPIGEVLRLLPPDGAEDGVAIVFASLLPQGEWAEWCHCG